MGFYKIVESPGKKGEIYVKAAYSIRRSPDFMTRGGAFYAIWTGERWSTDEFDVIQVIDDDIRKHIAEKEKVNSDITYKPALLDNFRNSGGAPWNEYRAFVSKRPTSFTQLDTQLCFLSDTPKLESYSSKKLPYDMKSGEFPNYEGLMSVLFRPEEREKLEWSVGSILAGDSVRNQKFIVLYGESGTGKSTFLNIVEKLFEGYHSYFDAKSLGNGAAFATGSFSSNPLVAIQHDGDLSRVLDNTKLNSIIAHESISINRKYETEFVIKPVSFIFMGTNNPVQITDSKSGLIRRLIDVYPSGRLVPQKEYNQMMDAIKFELGAIAHHCYSVYKKLGRGYYDSYKPIGMMAETDTMFNFVEENYYIFSHQPHTSLKQAYTLYKEYMEESALKYRLPKYKFKAALTSYFHKFVPRDKIDGKDVYNVYVGFRKDRFESVLNGSVKKSKDIPEEPKLVLITQSSVLDEFYKSYPAQYANRSGIPTKKWAQVETTLKDLNSRRLHYVKLPVNHILIDFDIVDETGEKSLEKNLEEASKWPPTYAEVSKSGKGVHLHYIYDGSDATELSRLYKEGVEIKVFVGDASLRRKLTKCNTEPIAHISSGLPKKEKKSMLNKAAVTNEKGLRALIAKNLRKEVHPATKPSVDFIYKILEDAYNNPDLTYDVSDLRTSVLRFAMSSSNQSDYCVSLTKEMKFKSDTPSEDIVIPPEDSPIVFFDVEVFPNLFIVCYKIQGKKNKPVRMVNPSPIEIEELFKYRLIGFNNRRYDNHILYGAYLGYNNNQLFQLSSSLIDNKNNRSGFGEAYHLSYADIYEFSSKKQSLKKFEIELGIHHRELDIPWSMPVPEDRWEEVGSYCENDVVATEIVFEDRAQDFVARLILTELSGLTPNHTTRQHTEKIIFGDDKKPQSKFEYTDLSKTFPGYTYDPMRKPKSLYRDIEPSEGGYVYSKSGVWYDVAVLDVVSMHPTSAIIMNIFGIYTPRYKELLEARVAIKHGDYELAKKLLGGILSKYLGSKEDVKHLSFALKIVINIVYGLTKASFPNKFLDPRNKDNIVAKRGALFMIDLQLAVEEKGFNVVHIKTDSIKIENATPEIIEFVHDFGKKYGYEFEHEATYSKFGLVNKAVYIAKYGWSEDSQDIGKWTPTGAQFAHPYVFKTLFSKEPIVFSDFCEAKSVKSTMYLDFNEGLQKDQHNYIHVGKVGNFVPVISGVGGGVLYRKEHTGNFNSVTGTKGYRWMEAEVVEANKLEDKVDLEYFRKLVDAAVDTISKYCDFDEFSES